MAATGDLHGNIEKLRDHLRRVHYDSALQVDALAAGEPAGFLPLLHFVLLRHSHRSSKVQHYELFATPGQSAVAVFDSRTLPDGVKAAFAKCPGVPAEWANVVVASAAPAD